MYLVPSQLHANNFVLFFFNRSNLRHRTPSGGRLNESVRQHTRATKLLLIEKTVCYICIDYHRLVDQAVCVFVCVCAAAKVPLVDRCENRHGGKRSMLKQTEAHARPSAHIRS